MRGSKGLRPINGSRSGSATPQGPSRRGFPLWLPLTLALASGERGSGRRLELQPKLTISPLTISRIPQLRRRLTLTPLSAEASVRTEMDCEPPLVVTVMAPDTLPLKLSRRLLPDAEPET